MATSTPDTSAPHLLIIAALREHGVISVFGSFHAVDDILGCEFQTLALGYITSDKAEINEHYRRAAIASAAHGIWDEVERKRAHLVIWRTVPEWIDDRDKQKLWGRFAIMTVDEFHRKVLVPRGMQDMAAQ